MKKLLYLLSLIMLAIACQTPQEKQYFTLSPEIDIAKQGNEAYLNGDWETLRSYFADSAIVYNNTWLDEGIPIDEYIANLQEGVTNFSEYSIGDDTIWEMIVTDEGDKWVHAWFQWKATHNNGEAIETVVHISWGFTDNKVHTMGVLFDNLPGYLASNPQPADSVSVE